MNAILKAGYLQISQVSHPETETTIYNTGLLYNFEPGTVSILTIVQNTCYSAEFDYLPFMTIFCSTPPFRLLHWEINSLLRKGAILTALCNLSCTCNYSQYFIVLNKGGHFWPILEVSVFTLMQNIPPPGACGHSSTPYSGETTDLQELTWRALTFT